MSNDCTRDIQAWYREQVVPPGAGRYGLVIGIEQYRDTRLNLRCARADARAVYDLMVDPECGMFPRDNVRLLLDTEATKENVWHALSHLRRQAGENATVWVYYAGHAAPEGSDLYWVTHDADVDDLYGTGLSSDQISKVLRDIRARRVVVLLDCCHAAATAAQKNPTRSILTAEEVFACYKGQGRITLSSSDGKEKSVELADVGQGAFTYFLARGLRGEADGDGNGVVTADELWSYLHEKVSSSSRLVGNPQRPVLLGEMTHDLPMTLNPIATARKKKIADAILALIGLGEDHLTTGEAEKCLALLRCGVCQGSDDLSEELFALAEGRLSVKSLRRLLKSVQPATAENPAEQRKERVAHLPALLADEVSQIIDKARRVAAEPPGKVVRSGWYRGEIIAFDVAEGLGAIDVKLPELIYFSRTAFASSLNISGQMAGLCVQFQIEETPLGCRARRIEPASQPGAPSENDRSRQPFSSDVVGTSPSFAGQHSSGSPRSSPVQADPPAAAPGATAGVRSGKRFRPIWLLAAAALAVPFIVIVLSVGGSRERRTDLVTAGRYAAAGDVPQVEELARKHPDVREFEPILRAARAEHSRLAAAQRTADLEKARAAAAAGDEGAVSRLSNGYPGDREFADHLANARRIAARKSDLAKARGLADAGEVSLLKEILSKHADDAEFTSLVLRAEEVARRAADLKTARDLARTGDIDGTVVVADRYKNDVEFERLIETAKYYFVMRNGCVLSHPDESQTIANDNGDWIINDLLVDGEYRLLRAGDIDGVRSGGNGKLVGLLSAFTWNQERNWVTRCELVMLDKNTTVRLWLTDVSIADGIWQGRVKEGETVTVWAHKIPDVPVGSGGWSPILIAIGNGHTFARALSDVQLAEQLCQQREFGRALSLIQPYMSKQCEVLRKRIVAESRRN